MLRKALGAEQAVTRWPQGGELRPWSPASAPAAHALLLATGQLEPSLDCAQWLEQLQADPEVCPRLCLSVFDASGLAGFAMGWASTFIRHLAVQPHARRHGLGAALLTQLFFLYSQRGEAFVDLTLRADNTDARRLYARAGMFEFRRYTL
ncbi:GNAT family N-acetyltransferase [Pseudomonas sp.]|uniref:GNAT family N-acetyltransferase n=1 Tax=Pseudomonas sp. TaxID=306 RepID=UPI00258B1A56|nr:GNAT family N-acetyltransferase [Pseudomonas sp.]